MPELRWNNDLTLGVDMIDNQHQELIRIANMIIRAVDRHDDRDHVDEIVRLLREYTVFHFHCEEMLMEDIRYPGRGDQVREHTQLKRDVKQFQRKLYLQEYIAPESILEFVKGWLLTHILAYDRDLAKFIKTQETTDSEEETPA